MQSVLLTSLTLQPPRAMGCRLSQPHPTFKRVLRTHTQVSVIVYIMYWATSPAPKPKCLTQNISVTLQAPHLDLQSHPGIPLLLWHLSVSKQQKTPGQRRCPNLLEAPGYGPLCPGSLPVAAYPLPVPSNPSLHSA